MENLKCLFMINLTLFLFMAVQILFMKKEESWITKRRLVDAWIRYSPSFSLGSLFFRVSFPLQCEFGVINYASLHWMEVHCLLFHPLIFVWDLPFRCNVSLRPLIVQSCTEWETWISPMVWTSWYVVLLYCAIFASRRWFSRLQYTKSCAQGIQQNCFHIRSKSWCRK